MINNLSLKAKLIIGSILPLIIVVVVSVISTRSITSLLDSKKWVDHTNRVIQEAMDITASAVDMETGMRGYLLAGQEEFLEPYNRGSKNFHEQVASLQKRAR